MQPRRAVLALVAALALSGLVAGCGDDTTPPVRTGSQNVSAADQACRDTWQGVGDSVRAASTRGVLLARVFESQWDSVRAGVSYYETTARASQCGRVLTDEKAKIAALTRLVRRAQPYDVEQLRTSALAERDAWFAHHPKGKEPPRVRAAYRTLRAKELVAERDIGPAVRQLATIDPRNPKAVKAAFKDVALLAGTSDAFQACKRALKVAKAFHHPKKAKKSKKAKK